MSTIGDHHTLGRPLGAKLLDLISPELCRLWIRRRVERVSVLDERTIERVVEFYIDLALFDEGDLPLEDDSTYILPLLCLSRTSHVMTRVDLGGCGELMRPTRDAERNFIIAGLREKWAILPDNTLGMIEALLAEPRMFVPRLARVPLSRSGKGPSSVYLMVM